MRVNKLWKMTFIIVFISIWTCLVIHLTSSGLGYSTFQYFAISNESSFTLQTVLRNYQNTNNDASPLSSIRRSSNAADVNFLDPKMTNVTDWDLSPVASAAWTPIVPVNVLLVAYQRTGSSVLGEMLSCHPKASYFFEPLIEISCNRNIRDKIGVTSAIKGLYQCDDIVLDMIDKSRKARIKMIRKLTGKPYDVSNPSQRCLESQIRVIKTIRLRMVWAKELLEDNDLNLKIIHLVRDPRAILHSVKQSETWTDTAKTPEYQCSNIRGDLKVGIQLPKERYLLVRYEDLVIDPLATAVKLYEFLGIPLHKSLAYYIATHTEVDKFVRHSFKQQGYFSTYRKSNHDYNAWKMMMGKDERSHIEFVCSDVIKSLKYQLTET